MQTAEFDINDFEANKQAELDKNMLVKFEYKQRPDQAATLKEGRPIYKEVLYIDMRPAGSQENVCKPATQYHIDRFPAHYQAFINRVEAPQEGTPLQMMRSMKQTDIVMTDSLIKELAFFNIKTVEHLAGWNDNDIGMMGGKNLKQQAKDYLAFAEGQAELAERHLLKQENEELKSGMAELTKRLEALEKNPPKAAKKKPTARKRKPAKKKAAKKKE